MRKQAAWLLLLLANLFWAGNYVFGKYVSAEVSPLGITLSRWLLALVLLFPIAQLLEKPDWRSLVKKWKSLIWLGLLGVIGYNIPLYAALVYTTPTNAALVNSLNPALIVLCSALLLRERFTLLQSIGFVASLGGVVMILTSGNLLSFFHTQYNRGDLLMLVAITAWTLYSIIAKKLTDIPPVTATAVSSAIGTLLLLPFALIGPLQWPSISWLSISGILYMALFPSVGSYILWNIAVRKLGASQAGITLHLIPVFTALFAFVSGEPITGAQIGGGIMVFIGVTLTAGFVDSWFQQVKNRSSTSL